ncbi:MAG: polar amino acid transport system substrate-binding protein [Bacteriovoracaceae bacterium]|jgi:polar amino acid transport system substrate-binding protein
MKIFIILIFLLGSTIIIADSQKGQSNYIFPKNKVISVTGHPDYPPVIWQEKGGEKLIGLAVEFLERALSEIKVKVNFIKSDTWGRAQIEVSQGKIDMLMPPYKSKERLKLLNYPRKPFLMDDTVVVVRKGKTFDFRKLEDLSTKSGVAIIHDSFGSTFDQFEKTNLKIKRLSKSEQCLKFLMKGRANFMVGGRSAILAMATKMRIHDQIEILPKRIINTGMYFAVSRKSKWNQTDLLEYLSMKIDEYEKEGYMKRLEVKYLNIYKKEVALN